MTDSEQPLAGEPPDWLLDSYLDDPRYNADPDIDHLTIQARMEEQRGSYDLALGDWEAARRLAVSRGKFVNAYHISSRTADLCSDIGRHAEAADYYDRAMAYYEHLNNLSPEAEQPLRRPENHTTWRGLEKKRYEQLVLFAAQAVLVRSGVPTERLP